MLSYLRNEVNLLKKILKASKFDTIDLMVDQIKRFNFELGIVKDGIEMCPSMKDLDELR